MYNNRQQFLDEVWAVKPQIDEIVDQYVHPYNPIYEDLTNALDTTDIVVVCELLLSLSFEINNQAYEDRSRLQINEILQLSEVKAKDIINLNHFKLKSKVMTLDDIRNKIKEQKVQPQIKPIEAPIPKKVILPPVVAQVLTSDL